MSFRKLCLLSVCLGFFPLLRNAQAIQNDTSSWQIETPYPDNPTKTATLSGTGQASATQGKTWLVVICRPDSSAPFAALKVDKQLARHFPVNYFEGPGAPGQKARLLQVSLEQDELTRSYQPTGSYQDEDVFEWDFTPQKTELQRWIKAEGKMLTINVVKPDKQDVRLQAQFKRPRPNTALSDLVAPCLKN